MPTAGFGQRDGRRGQTTVPDRKARLQDIVDEPNHGADHLRRRVVGAGPLSQPVIIDLEELFVEVEPRLGVALADRRASRPRRARA